MTASKPETAVNIATDQLAAARAVCCLTGAGISAESGVPTFRSPGGFWAGRRPEDLATPEAFLRNPQEVWQFYSWRRELLRGIHPNAGHFALAALTEVVPQLTLITQNVDDLHRLADSDGVLELHGNLWVDRCTRCTRENRLNPAEYSATIPHCDDCCAMMRPGVIWFGESLPIKTLQEAQNASAACDVMLVVGTSSLVHPANALATWAKTNGAFVIEINPEETPLSPLVDLRFALPSGEILPQLVEALRLKRRSHETF